MRKLIIPIITYHCTPLPRVEVMPMNDLPDLREQEACSECGRTKVLPALSLEERGKELGHILYEQTPALFLMGLLGAIGPLSLQDALVRKKA